MVGVLQLAELCCEVSVLLTCRSAGMLTLRANSAVLMVAAAEAAPVADPDGMAEIEARIFLCLLKGV